jgi:hypothetical protein
VARRTKRGSATVEHDQAMPALAPGCIEFKLNAPLFGQATQLAQQFVARHATWMAIDRRGAKAEPLEVEGRWR